MNIDVRIRCEADTEAVPLTWWPIERLNELPGLIKQWGIFDGYEAREELFGQFVVGIRDAYFELVVVA